jgi:hypothetical protein
VRTAFRLEEPDKVSPVALGHRPDLELAHDRSMLPARLASARCRPGRRRGARADWSVALRQSGSRDTRAWSSMWLRRLPLGILARPSWCGSRRRSMNTWPR